MRIGRSLVAVLWSAGLAAAAVAQDAPRPPESVPGPLRPVDDPPSSQPTAPQPATRVDRRRPPPSAAIETPTAAPVRARADVYEGLFRPGAKGEKAAGRAIVRTANSDLKLEKLAVTPGRDLELWLVAVDRVVDGVDLAETKHVSLGRLKKPAGDQTYRLPPEIDVTVYRNVVVWSRRERAARAAALLAPAAPVKPTKQKRPPKR